MVHDGVREAHNRMEMQAMKIAVPWNDRIRAAHGRAHGRARRRSDGPTSAAWCVASDRSVRFAMPEMPFVTFGSRPLAPSKAKSPWSVALVSALVFFRSTSKANGTRATCKSDPSIPTV